MPITAEASPRVVQGGREGPPFSIVCLSRQDWDATLPTNRQQIMRRAAERGHRVVFVETGDFLGRSLARLVRGRDDGLARRLLAGAGTADGVVVRKAVNLVPWGQRFPLAAAWNRRVTARAVRRLVRGLPRPVVLWVYDPVMFSRPGEWGEDLAVYDCVDDYAEQAGPARRAFVADADARAGRAARLVFATARTLAERHGRSNPRTHLVPNVGDFSHFAPAADRDLAADEVAALPRPVLGFAGNLVATKVDFALLERLADSRPEWTLLLVGPAGDAERARVEALAARPNVHWTGHRPYAELPRYVAAFDVALVPYAANDYTRSCFPLKVHEYLAAGRPVVATGLPELAGMEPEIVLAEGAEGVAAAAEAALAADGADARRRRVALAAENTWEARTERLLALVEAELA